ncbi:MAG: hypothetical protein IT354_01390 [Gemmatimonadaceae bacterium]|nr:hypothetical protein [Gemmatimonadaceae bacterium]
MPLPHVLHRTVVAALLAASLMSAPGSRGMAGAQSSVGERAIRAVHARWNGKTYRTLTFVQETQFADGRSEIWFESLKAPGLLRIDIAPGDSTARMMLFRNDSLYQGRAGRPVRGGAYVHPLMVLFTDIATSDPAVTIGKVTRMGYDLSKTRDDMFLGKPVTVIGAGPGDSTSSQFWIEKDRQLVVRLIDREQRPGAGLSDTRVLRYAKAGNGWVESEIVFYQGGKLIQRELYNEISTDVPLDEAIFQPRLENVPAWIAARKKP